MLVTARAIQGAFGAVLAPAALAMVTTAFTDPEERGKAFSIYGSIAGAGAAVGLLLGGVLTQYLNWRWTLYVNLVFAGITLIGTQLLLLRERGEAKGGLEVTSTVLVSTGLFGIVFGLSHAANSAVNTAKAGGSVTLASAFGNPTTIVCLIVGAALVAWFLVRQTKVERPILPLRVISDRSRGGSFLAILLAATAMFAVFLFLTVYLQDVKGYSPVGAGLAFMPLVVVLSAAAAISQTVVLPRVGARVLEPVGMALGAIGLYFFTRLTASSDYATVVLPGLLVTGVAMGVVFATSMNTSTAHVEPEYAGSASATVNVTQQVGGSIGTALLSTVAIAASLAWVPHGTAPGTSQQTLQNMATVHGYTVAFWWGVVIFAIGAVATAIVLPSGKPVPASEHSVLAAV
jgi:MFS family permease